MAADQTVTVAPDSTGKRIDNSEITRADGSLAERQRVNLSDPSDPNAHVSVSGEDGRGTAGVQDRHALEQLVRINQKLDVLIELMRELVQD
jgi:hypothetical protein